jgi:subtilisin-like proprotein convertase family protein
MRRLLNAFISVLLVTSLKGQSFPGNGGPITNNGIPTYFEMTISTLSGNLGDNFGVEEICVNINHSNMEEVTVSMRSPSGVLVELINSTSIKGANFSGTCFNSGAPNSITSVSAPYAGSLKPTGYIGRLNNGGPANGKWTLIVKDYNPAGSPGSVVDWSIRFSTNPAKPVKFSSSNLPLVFINTGNQPITTNTMVCDFSIVDNGSARNNLTDPKNGYFGKATVNVRGNSSQIFEKKAMKIELRDGTGTVPIDATLLHLPGESDWVLSPGYSDKSLMRNLLTYDLSRDMGRYSPRGKFVEVFINDEYWGVYTLVEKPKRNSERIDVFKMLPGDNAYPYITGGYIVQINRPEPDPKLGWFSTFPGNSVSNPPSKFYYQLEYPKPEEISSPQLGYIKAVLDTFERVMDGPNFADPTNGYRKYIDVLSFVDYFIISELSKNIDGYKLSTYIYKDNILDGGKLKMGPVWDYDIAWHNANYGAADFEYGWQYDQLNTDTPIPNWWKKLMTDDYFKNMLYCRWHTLRKNFFSDGSINAKIDAYANTLQEAQQRNFQQFPILDAYIFPNTAQQIGPNYMDKVNDIKAWVSKRAAFLDQNIPGACADVGVAEIRNSEARLNAYPNPFNNSFDIGYSLSGTANVRLELFNIVGARVQLISEKEEKAGEHFQKIDGGTLPAGTYLLKMSVDNKVLYKKIVKTETQQ